MCRVKDIYSKINSKRLLICLGINYLKISTAIHYGNYNISSEINITY